MKFSNIKSINLNSESKKAFMVKFLIFSTILFLIYLLIAKFLFSVTLSVANIMIAIFGFKYEIILESDIDISYVLSNLINLNIFTYIALFFATPKIRTMKSRIYFLVFGSIFLFLTNVAFAASQTILLYSEEFQMIPYLCVTFCGTFGEVFFPFILWFVMAHKWLLKDINTLPK